MAGLTPPATARAQRGRAQRVRAQRVRAQRVRAQRVRAQRGWAPLGWSPSWRRVTGLVVLAAVLVFTGCSAGQSDTDPYDRLVLGGGKTFTQIPPAERKLAAVASGPDLDGTGTVTTATPGKVTVINVWGSWCAPCRAEAPDLSAASTETKADAVFVGINVRDYDPAPARAFVRAFDIPYAHIYDPQGAQLIRFAGDLAPNAIPSTLIIDREGRTAARLVGAVSETTLVKLVRDIGRGR